MVIEPNYQQDLKRFYQLLDDLKRTIGTTCLKDCSGRMGWPKRGVYFFFEDGEVRPGGITPRVVRVGTHAVSKGSRTTLWHRLRTHRGTLSGGGNHRGSIFRLHVGTALLARNESLLPKPQSWGKGSSAKRDVREGERHVEHAVSECIGSMPFLHVDADDESGPQSIRKTIEANSITLLSQVGIAGSLADPPSADWLGQFCGHEAVRQSGLWNVQHVSMSTTQDSWMFWKTVRRGRNDHDHGNHRVGQLR